MLTTKKPAKAFECAQTMSASRNLSAHETDRQRSPDPDNLPAGVCNVPPRAKTTHYKEAFGREVQMPLTRAFPISWRESKIDGFSARISTSSIHGFQAYTTFGHTRARFFGPEVGGLLFNSPLETTSHPAV